MQPAGRAPTGGARVEEAKGHPAVRGATRGSSSRRTTGGANGGAVDGGPRAHPPRTGWPAATAGGYAAEAGTGDDRGSLPYKGGHG